VHERNTGQYAANEKIFSYWKKSSVGDMTALTAAAGDDVTLMPMTSSGDTGKQVSLCLR